MKKGWKISLGIIALTVVILVGVPFLIPVPPLEGTLPLKDLLFEDSQFIEIEGVDVHYQRYGAGDPAIILLHGFGASTFSWREVTQPLARRGAVIAYDRPGFGLTERVMREDWDGMNPYTLDSQVRILLGLLDDNGIDRAVLIGNSAGGTVAVAFTLAHPDRVAGLVLVDAAIYQVGGRYPQWLKPLLQTPHARRLGPLLVRSVAGPSGDDLIRTAWHEPARITEDILAGYRRPLQAPNWDRALWEFTLASAPTDIAAKLSQISVPTLVVTGDDDRIVATDLSIRLAGEISRADLAVLTACGHVPQEECPDQFMNAVNEFLDSL